MPSPTAPTRERMEHRRATSARSADTSTNSTSRSVGGLTRDRQRFGKLATVPAVIVLAATLVLPTLLTAYYSVHENGPAAGVGSFTGLRNYQAVFEAPIFWTSLKVTLIFTVGFVIFATVIGLLAAALLNIPFSGNYIFRAFLIVPWAAPWLVIGIIWNRFLSSSTSGSIPQVLEWLGLPGGGNDFLAHPTGALVFSIVAAGWRQASFAGLLLLAGLQSLPPEIKDAAAVDGAGPWQRFRFITLPWLRPILAIVIVLNIIYGFMQFDIIFALTHGGPGTSTELLTLLIYQTMYTDSHLGTGAALSVVLALLALACGLWTVRVVYRKVGV